MGKGKKADVQFILPDPEPAPELEIADDEYLETPYTSILMSTASGDGCALHLPQHLLWQVRVSAKRTVFVVAQALHGDGEDACEL
jgi:hypothetical protein